MDQEQVQKHFSELALNDLSVQELIDDGGMSEVLSEEHRGFSLWCRDSCADDDEPERFVTRYEERGPISLEKPAFQTRPRQTGVSEIRDIKPTLSSPGVKRRLSRVKPAPPSKAICTLSALPVKMLRTLFVVRLVEQQKIQIAIEPNVSHKTSDWFSWHQSPSSSSFIFK